MRIACPHCGPRDRREFSPRGAALTRPGQKAAPEDWDAYIHQRDNPAGITREHWYHIPCGTWLTVTRDTVTHVIEATE